MAKLLVERKSTLKAGKAPAEEVKFEETQAPVEKHESSGIHGGRIKRIQWTETHEQTHEPVHEIEYHESSYEPVEPVEEHHTGEEVIRVREYKPRHYASIDEINSDVDHIDRVTGHIHEEPASYEERTVYETDRSTVRGAKYGSKTTYYLEDAGRVSTRRALTRSMVDEVIRDVDLDREYIVEEEVIEYEPRIVEEVVEVKPKKAGKPAKKAPAKKVVAAPLVKATPKPAAKPKGDFYYDYKGDIHPVIEIEGIGPTYEKKLHAMGIATSARLCYEDSKKIAKKLDTDEKRVVSWQAMAELAKVNGIGPQYAEALVRAGITGIQELKDRKPAEMSKQVNEYLDGLKNNVLGQKVSTQRITTWQKNAKPMRRVRQAIPEE